MGKSRIFKVILLGDGSVGKTSLRQVYMGENFKKRYHATLGADFSLKKFELDGEEIQLQIWDLAGQPKFSAVRNKYYLNSSGLLLVFDLTRPETFENIPNWLNEYLDGSDDTLVPIILIGNKHDLIENKNYQISPDEIQQYVDELREWGESRSENFSINFAMTSARYHLNVDPSFKGLTKMMIENIKNES